MEKKQISYTFSPLFPMGGACAVYEGCRSDRYWWIIENMARTECVHLCHCVPP